MSGENPFGVRKAMPEDRTALLEFLMLHQWENALGPLDAERVGRMIDRLTLSHGGVAGIISGADGIEATIGLEIYRWWYSSEDGLYARWLSVHPLHRQKGHAQKLVRFAQWCCRNLETGKRLPLYLECSSLPVVEGMSRLFKRHADVAATIFVDRSITA